MPGRLPSKSSPDSNSASGTPIAERRSTLTCSVYLGLGGVSGNFFPCESISQQLSALSKCVNANRPAHHSNPCGVTSPAPRIRPAWWACFGKRPSCACPRKASNGSWKTERRPLVECGEEREGTHGIRLVRRLASRPPSRLESARDRASPEKARAGQKNGELRGSPQATSTPLPENPGLN
jgi:hypothetical protein